MKSINCKLQNEREYTIAMVDYKKDITKNWFIKISYKASNGENKVVHKKGGINYIKDVKQRCESIENLVRYYTDRLNQGWNPTDREDAKQIQDVISLNDALNFGLKKKIDKNLSKDTIKAYKNTMDRIKKVCIDIGMNVDISKITRRHIKILMDEYKERNNASNANYNKTLRYLSATLNELLDYYIETNPAHNIKILPTNESEGFIRPTDDELIIIKNYLEDNFWNFSVLFKMLYDSGARTSELLNVKVGDIMTSNWTFKVNSNVNKTNTFKFPAITPFMQEIIKVFIEGTEKEWYLFGTFQRTGEKYNKETMFCPAPYKIERDTATKIWKKLIKDTLGLNCDMYATKHKGGDDKIMAGVSLDALREQYGHASKIMTTRYLSNLYKVNINEIQSKSPRM